MKDDIEQAIRESYEERAAIKEYLGNVSRETAEKEAREEVYKSGQRVGD